jgi:hypothetical protein
MTMIQKKVDAIAYYGSWVRGDDDRFSDRDLLLVSNDSDALDEVKSSLTSQGYSCACYDWDKLNLLASKKALFIQHLKQESRIVIDRGHKLHSLLSSYTPASTYSNEIDGARRMVSLTECFPDSPQGIGWALDILTVGFRNLAILTLANEGKYVFSFGKLVSELSNMGLVDSRHHQNLVNLRAYKSNFRTKQFSLLPSKRNVFDLQRVIGKMFGVGLESKVISEESFHDYCLHSRKAAQTDQWYLKARLYEGAFLTLDRSMRDVDVQISSRFRAVEEAIANPSCYSALFSNSADNLRKEVLNLAMELGLKAA